MFITISDVGLRCDTICQRKCTKSANTFKGN